MSYDHLTEHPICARDQAKTKTQARSEPQPAADPDTFHPDDYEALRRRMGDGRLRQRLSEQVYHEAGASHQEGIFIRLSKLLDVDRFVLRTVKLSGLYRWGYRNFQSVRVVERELCHPRVPAGLDGLRILHLSDLHLDLDPGIGRIIAERVRGLEYDLAVLTGDFRNTTRADAGPSVRQTRKLLAALRPPLYGILGNHDFIEIVPPLERAGLRFLLNEVEVIKRGGARLYLGGVDDAHFYKTHDLARVREAIPDDGFSILLCHSPEAFHEAASHGYDIMLCGHTHGGQICLPGGVALIKVCDVPRRLLAGGWTFRGMTGYTSVGTGSCGVPLRFFCPPEATVHILRRR
jgi:predicted MPP superfamily phosphohydrolase